MAIDPIIQKKANEIRTKVYGKEVREGLASGLETMSSQVVDNSEKQRVLEGKQNNVESQFQQVIDETTGKDIVSAPEIIAARGTHRNLSQRLLSNDDHIIENTWLINSKSEFEIIAHRGFSALAPESTVASFTEAIAAGFDSLETDIQFTQDGVPVCIHDSSVDRTTNGTGEVKTKTYAELSQLDASKTNPFYSPSRIPTFETYLKLAKGNSRFIYPEIKDYRTKADIKIMVDLIVKHGWEGKCVICAFKHRDLDEVRMLSSEITLGYLINDVNTLNILIDMLPVGANAVALPRASVLLENPSIVERANAIKLPIVAWTVDSPDDVKKLKEIGINRIISNKIV